jgi:hypothetical protein
MSPLLLNYLLNIILIMGHLFNGFQRTVFGYDTATTVLLAVILSLS